jgi:hypothetical protein
VLYQHTKHAKEEETKQSSTIVRVSVRKNKNKNKSASDALSSNIKTIAQITGIMKRFVFVCLLPYPFDPQQTTNIYVYILQGHHCHHLSSFLFLFPLFPLFFFYSSSSSIFFLSLTFPPPTCRMNMCIISGLIPPKPPPPPPWLCPPWGLSRSASSTPESYLLSPNGHRRWGVIRWGVTVSDNENGGEGQCTWWRVEAHGVVRGWTNRPTDRPLSLHWIPQHFKRAVDVLELQLG